LNPTFSLAFFLFALHVAALGGLTTWLADFGATRRDFWSLLASVVLFFLSYGAAFSCQRLGERVSWGPVQRLYHRYGSAWLNVSLLFLQFMSKSGGVIFALLICSFVGSCFELCLSKLITWYTYWHLLYYLYSCHQAV